MSSRVRSRSASFRSGWVRRARSPRSWSSRGSSKATTARGLTRGCPSPGCLPWSLRRCSPGSAARASGALAPRPRPHEWPKRFAPLRCRRAGATSVGRARTRALPHFLERSVMGRIGGGELLLIALIALLLFGAGRLADIGKGLGEGIKNFKKGIKDDEEPAGDKQLPPKKADEPAGKDEK